jgi:hypothetical protein
VNTYIASAGTRLTSGQIGRVLGKALYEGILVDVSFAGFFCRSICSSVA